MSVRFARRFALMALSLCGALGQARGQTAADTLAIASLVGRAFAKEAAEPTGLYIVDTAAAGSRFSLAVIKASSRSTAAANGAGRPVCRFSPTKAEANSPYLFAVVIDSFTRRRALLSVEVACDQGPMRGYSADIRYVAEFRNGRWRLLPGRRATVT